MAQGYDNWGADTRNVLDRIAEVRAKVDWKMDQDDWDRQLIVEAAMRDLGRILIDHGHPSVD